MEGLCLRQLVATLLLAVADAQLAQSATIRSTVVSEEGDIPGSVMAGSHPPVFDVMVPEDAATLVISATADSGSKSHPILYCIMLGSVALNDQVPSRDNANFVGEQQVQAPTVTISAVDFSNSTDVRCAVYNRGPSSAPLNFTLSVRYAESTPQLVASEQAAVQLIFNSCCDGPERCTRWKQNTAASLGNLCAVSMNTCNEEGELVELNMRGYDLLCNFPLDAFLNFTQLRTLNLRDNPALEGAFSTIAEELSEIESLQDVNLERDAGIRGPLSTDGQDGICMLAGTAKSININAMSLEGTLPPCVFSGFMAVEQLIASFNKLSGTLPDMNPGIGEPSLQVVRLSNNVLSGDLPTGWLRQTELTWLDLSSNNITGTLLPPRKDFSFTTTLAIPVNLARLVMNDNALTGAFPGPHALDGLQSLEIIDLSNNQLDELPTGAAASTQADVGAWDVTHGVFTAAPPLHSVLLATNSLKGQYPIGFGALPSLVELDISNNQLSGTLPALQLGNASTPGLHTPFSELMLFSAGFNNFTGSIPGSWAQLGMFDPNVSSTLRVALFDMQNNSLTGALPQFLAYKNVRLLQPSPNVNLSGNTFESTDCNEYAYTGASCTSTAPPPSSPIALPTEDSPSPQPSPLPHPSASPTPQQPAPAPADTVTSSSSGGLSSGASAGIAVAVILAVLAGVAGFICARKRRQSRGGINSRFERFQDSHDASDGAWQEPSPHQPPTGWDAYQQQSPGLQMSSRRNAYDP